MEEAALLSVRPYLEPGTDTVGTRLDVSHLSATPVGMKVRAESTPVSYTHLPRLFIIGSGETIV